MPVAVVCCAVHIFSGSIVAFCSLIVVIFCCTMQLLTVGSACLTGNIKHKICIILLCFPLTVASNQHGLFLGNIYAALDY